MIVPVIQSVARQALFCFVFPRLGQFAQVFWRTMQGAVGLSRLIFLRFGPRFSRLAKVDEFRHLAVFLGLGAGIGGAAGDAVHIPFKQRGLFQ
jgi:hypothetical protein